MLTNKDSSQSEKVIILDINFLWEVGILPDSVDFLKIDSEGSELEIIKSITDKETIYFTTVN